MISRDDSSNFRVLPFLAIQYRYFALDKATSGGFVSFQTKNTQIFFFAGVLFQYCIQINTQQPQTSHAKLYSRVELARMLVFSSIINAA